MKCENCRERMNVVLGNTDITVEDTHIKVLNIPVLVCPNCKKQVIHDVLTKRAENYVHQYGAQNNTIDFGVCEQKESEDSIAIMQTLGIL